MKIAVSACLLGAQCKYNGGSNANAFLIQTAGGSEHSLIPVCPECFGGLPIPRAPAEQKDGGVFLKDGTDVTANFQRGARCALALAKACGAQAAILKARSPSCGSGMVYDGSFSGTVRSGDGIATALFKQEGIPVVSEEEAEAFLKQIQSN